MKFYKRFPGDIQIKTGGLSMAEFGAYDRLLDHYYATEEPIEACEVYSIARAMGKSDREAVDKVLRRYFDVDANGNYTQGRADEMIAEAQPKIAAARTNGKAGGRPVGSTKKPTGLFSETKRQTETPDLEKASQSQSKEIPLPPSEVPPLPAKPKAVTPQRPDDVAEGVWRDWLTLRMAKKAPVTPTVLDGAKSEAALAGLSLEAFLGVWCRRGSQGLEAAWLKPHERGQVPQTFRERDAANAAARIHEMTGGLVVARPAPTTRRNDALQEVFDATRIVG